MNSFGRVFRVSIFGESHGPAIGVTIDGCPPGLFLHASYFEEDLARRAPRTEEHTARREPDKVEILSGIYEDATTGAPITLLVHNSDTRSNDYEEFKHHPRPSHTDVVNRIKYDGYNDPRGGGASSGRVTVAMVLAGTIAKRFLYNKEDIMIDAHCIAKIPENLQAGDSVGGIISCTIEEVPIGLGEPFFDSVESMISHLLFSIPGVKGVEFGDGFACVYKRGSKRNDRYVNDEFKTLTNNEGGVNGGISNGNAIRFRVAVKPTPSIGLPQDTYDTREECMTKLQIVGRHDMCFATRVPVIVESAAAIALMDLYLIRKTQSMK